MKLLSDLKNRFFLFSRLYRGVRRARRAHTRGRLRGVRAAGNGCHRKLLASRVQFLDFKGTDFNKTLEEYVAS